MHLLGSEGRRGAADAVQRPRVLPLAQLEGGRVVLPGRFEVAAPHGVQHVRKAHVHGDALGGVQQHFLVAVGRLRVRLHLLTRICKVWRMDPHTSSGVEAGTLAPAHQDLQSLEDGPSHLIRGRIGISLQLECFSAPACPWNCLYSYWAAWRCHQVGPLQPAVARGTSIAVSPSINTWYVM